MRRLASRALFLLATPLALVGLACSSFSGSDAPSPATDGGTDAGTATMNDGNDAGAVVVSDAGTMPSDGGAAPCVTSPTRLCENFDSTSSLNAAIWMSQGAPLVAASAHLSEPNGLLTATDPDAGITTLGIKTQVPHVKGRFIVDLDFKSTGGTRCTILSTGTGKVVLTLTITSGMSYSVVFNGMYSGEVGAIGVGLNNVWQHLTLDADYSGMTVVGTITVNGVPQGLPALPQVVPFAAALPVGIAATESTAGACSYDFDNIDIRSL